ncbi:hypothetical protein HJG60_011734 [Phyllostomus discolor]|uniref:Uncharacterized protein n=1 Tax=Phyllostomus discolor TaxID=89673 RepID=A0A833ZVZ3_9CHIR|nr:hypothetical protein HJG60_011734 [Phyllostomus discolor]
MAPTESDEDPSCTAGEAPHLTLPANLQTLHLNRPTFSPESKLEWNNDIPEVVVGILNTGEIMKLPNGWSRKSSVILNLTSGSDMPKLVFKPSPRLQSISRHQKGLPQDGGPGRMFRRSVYLPVHSDVDSTHQMVKVSTLEKPINSSSMESIRTRWM